jgi:SAM-dependent methyltransferase
MIGQAHSMGSEDAEMRAYYAQGKEWDRLGDPKGVVEFERTKEILQQRLPVAPATIADIGGGPGRYALWLAELGYAVEHRDLMPAHVEQLQRSSGSIVHTEVGDARDLNLPDSSVDAVVLLGPLYHLREQAHRVQALREARRIVRPGGPVFAAVISRWAPRLDGVVAQRLYESYPNLLALLPDVELTGNLPPIVPDGFSGYTHRPGELIEEIAEAELALEDLVGVEGMPLAASDLQARSVDPAAWQVVLDTARAIERVPELLGLSPHLMATARRSANEQSRTVRH